MVIRTLIRLLFANPQVSGRLINALAESRPIRWAARWTAYGYLRARGAIEQKTKVASDELSKAKPANFDFDRFKETFRREFEKAKRDQRRKQ